MHTRAPRQPVDHVYLKQNNNCICARFASADVEVALAHSAGASLLSTCCGRTLLTTVPSLERSAPRGTSTYGAGSPDLWITFLQMHYVHSIMVGVVARLSQTNFEPMQFAS
jgi:hypothetical protein